MQILVKCKKIQKAIVHVRKSHFCIDLLLGVTQIEKDQDIRYYNVIL